MSEFMFLFSCGKMVVLSDSNCSRELRRGPHVAPPLSSLLPPPPRERPASHRPNSAKFGPGLRPTGEECRGLEKQMRLWCVYLGSRSDHFRTSLSFPKCEPLGRRRCLLAASTTSKSCIHQACLWVLRYKHQGAVLGFKWKRQRHHQCINDKKDAQ